MELPPEVWDHILNYLEVNSLYNLSITCNKLNQIIINKRKDLYERLRVEQQIIVCLVHTNYYEGFMRYLPSGKILSGYFYPSIIDNRYCRSNYETYPDNGYIRFLTNYETILFGFKDNDNIVNSIIIDENPNIANDKKRPKRTEYTLIDGWISDCKHFNGETTENILYDRGIPLLDEEQQKKYSSRIRYKPQVRKDGTLILDSYMNNNTEIMIRIYKDNFIGILSLQYPDENGFIDTLKVKVKTSDPKCRFVFDKFKCVTPFILNLNKITSRLNMSHLWVFLKSYN